MRIISSGITLFITISTATPGDGTCFPELITNKALSGLTPVFGAILPR
jgi:hypothetical protein